MNASKQDNPLRLQLFMGLDGKQNTVCSVYSKYLSCTSYDSINSKGALQSEIFKSY